MSRLDKAAYFFRSAVLNLANHPHDIGDYVKHLPFEIEGMQFGRSAAISTNLEAGDDFLDPNNPLLSYFNAKKEGAGIWKWLHYFDIYQRHFSKFVGREVHVLEVGIYSGGSLAMWKEYFGPQCHVYGVDIEKACTSYQDERTTIFIGDQADRSFWKKVRDAAPKIDIVIDDGGHSPEQQKVTLEEMLPHLRPGGVFLCEDIHGANNEFAAYVHGLASNLHYFEQASMPDGMTGAGCVPAEFQRSIRGIHLYPFAAVIEKREQKIQRLLAPRHGSQWQPFFKFFEPGDRKA